MGRFQENPDGTGKSPHIQHLRPRHRAIVRAVAFGNFTPTQIAERFSMSFGQVSRIMGSPIFQAEIQRLQEEAEIVSMDMAKDLRMMGEIAIQNLDEDLHLPASTLDERKHRASVSLDVLEMLGLRKNNGGTGNINIQKIFNIQNNVNVRDVEDLGEQEIRDEILELTQGNEGLYE